PLAGTVRREIRAWPPFGGIISANTSHQQQPATPESGVHCHVLLAIRHGQADRAPHRARAYLESPEEMPGPRVDRLEPAVQGAVEHHVPARRQDAAPHRVTLSDLPHPAAAPGIPGDERAQVAVPPRPGVIWSS